MEERTFKAYKGGCMLHRKSKHNIACFREWCGFIVGNMLDGFVFAPLHIGDSVLLHTFSRDGCLVTYDASAGKICMSYDLIMVDDQLNNHSREWILSVLESNNKRAREAGYEIRGTAEVVKTAESSKGGKVYACDDPNCLLSVSAWGKWFFQELAGPDIKTPQYLLGNLDNGFLHWSEEYGMTILQYTRSSHHGCSAGVELATAMRKLLPSDYAVDLATSLATAHNLMTREDIKRSEE